VRQQPGRTHRPELQQLFVDVERFVILVVLLVLVIVVFELEQQFQLVVVEQLQLIERIEFELVVFVEQLGQLQFGKWAYRWRCGRLGSACVIGGSRRSDTRGLQAYTSVRRAANRGCRGSPDAVPLRRT
jgi:hypothetical protein